MYQLEAYPKQLLVELKVICTNTNFLFLCCFAVGCLGGGIGGGDAYYLFT